MTVSAAPIYRYSAASHSTCDGGVDRVALYPHILMNRFRPIFVFGSLLAIALAGCSAGIKAPPVAGVESACTATFCVEYPSGWAIDDEGDSFLVLSHPDDPEATAASVSQVNMEGVMAANGGRWPASPADVVEVFWASIDSGDADLGTIDFRSDGSIESFGAFEGGRLWFLLTPTDSTRAVGVEVRGPNSSWESHARVFLDGLMVLP